MCADPGPGMAISRPACSSKVQPSFTGERRELLPDHAAQWKHMSLHGARSLGLAAICSPLIPDGVQNYCRGVVNSLPPCPVGSIPLGQEREGHKALPNAAAALNPNGI